MQKGGRPRKSPVSPDRPLLCNTATRKRKSEMHRRTPSSQKLDCRSNLAILERRNISSDKLSLGSKSEKGRSKGSGWGLLPLFRVRLNTCYNSESRSLEKKALHLKRKTRLGYRHHSNYRLIGYESALVKVHKNTVLNCLRRHFHD